MGCIELMELVKKSIEKELNNLKNRKDDNEDE